MADLETAERNRYAVQLQPLGEDEGGGWLAEVPDLPGCISDGDTPEEAVRNVEDALHSWVATAEEFGDPVPEPGTSSRHSGKWVMRVSRSLHMRLAQRAKAEGVSLNAFAAQLLAEGIGRRK